MNDSLAVDCQILPFGHPGDFRVSCSINKPTATGENVIGGVENGGPFNDLLHLSPTGIHFQFAEAAGPARVAADKFADFVDSYAPLITMPPDVRDQLRVYILALAIDTIVEDNPLG